MKKKQDHWGFHLHEERSIIECYFRARAQVKSGDTILTEGQSTNLDIVDLVFIKRNGEFSHKLWDNFLNVLTELGIGPPILSTTKGYPSDGGWYQIPRRDKYHVLHAKKLARRRERRLHAIREFKQAYGLDIGEEKLDNVVTGRFA